LNKFGIKVGATRGVARRRFKQGHEHRAAATLVCLGRDMIVKIEREDIGTVFQFDENGGRRVAADDRVLPAFCLCLPDRVKSQIGFEKMGFDIETRSVGHAGMQVSVTPVERAVITDQAVLFLCREISSPDF
jgi:hypothetical protein